MPAALPLHLAVVLALAAGAAAAQPAGPLTRMQPMLTRAGALAVLRLAEAEAARSGDPEAIAVVDADGALLAFERLDAVRPGSADLAIGKARSAALLQRPTAELEENVANNRVGLATAGLTALRGGAPLRVEGAVVGAVGLAGLKKENDAANAAAVAAHFGASP